MRILPTTFEVSIVQPSVNSKAPTEDMIRILGGTANLQVVCS